MSQFTKAACRTGVVAAVAACVPRAAWACGVCATGDGGGLAGWVALGLAIWFAVRLFRS